MLVSEILTRTVARHPERVAGVCCGERWTYGQLGERVQRLAGGLLRRGLEPGDRVAILHRNCHRYLEAYLAAARAGLVLCPLNHRLAAAELDAILADAGASLLMAEDCFADRVARLAETPQVLLAPDDHEALVASGSTREFEAAEDTAPALLYYTSGTTGRQKGVVLTHRNLVAHAASSIFELKLTCEDVWIHAAPMFHLADAWAVWALTQVGGRHVFAPRFEAEAVLATMAREGVTITNMIPTMLGALAHHPRIGEHDLSSLRVLLSGGAPIAPELVRRIMDVFGCDYVQTYGMTETSPYLTMSILHPHLEALPEAERFRYKASTGRAVRGIDLKVVDEGGREVPADGQAVGEILVRGEAVTPGYWNLPGESAAAFADGWLRTGDLAVMDPEGYVNIVDRKKDMIVTGGENVFSTEVENILYEHPAVLEAAVFGVPDERWGEAVTAAVALKPDCLALESELLDFCRARIAGYKVPRTVRFMEELPKTGSGKIAKRLLRANQGD